jgi:hypothetical protein
MGYSGSLFTWSNERHDSSFTKERLDRGVANGSFALLFPQLLIEVLPARCSDHAPLLVHLQDQRNCRRDRQRPFKYEVWWQAYANFPRVVRTVWRVKMPGRDSWSNVKSKLMSSQSACRQWRKTRSDPTEALISQKTSALGVLLEEADEESLGLVKSLQVEINDLIELEDLKWRQRAKQNWLKHGDKNSKFFHACVNHKRRNNMLLKIQNLEGGMCSGQMAVEEAFFMYYFKGVFRSNGIENVEFCLSQMPRRISEEMNCRLL